MSDQSFLNQAANWPHRFDESAARIRFVPVPRALHARCTFITDEHLPSGLSVNSLPLSEIRETLSEPTSPRHFVFHSAYCCSTMVARAFDMPGRAMGLKEPQILNDLLGWRRRGAEDDQVRAVLRTSLNLLSRPFEEGEVSVIKPSNIANPLAKAMLELSPDAKALLLYAPIESYLQSIAKKGMWGRRWVREVLVATIGDRNLIGGFEDQNLLELTDLQVAALGWLSQHALFTRLIEEFGEGRVRTLDSATLLADQRSAMSALTQHFGIDLSDGQLDEVMAGPAFTTHSKQAAERFDAGDRAKEQADMAEIHAEEIGMVAAWTQAVAQSQGIELTLPASLLS